MDTTGLLKGAQGPVHMTRPVWSAHGPRWIRMALCGVHRSDANALVQGAQEAGGLNGWKFHLKQISIYLT